MMIMNNNQTVWVDAAREGYEGHYTCTARNKVGQTSRDFIIRLTGEYNDLVHGCPTLLVRNCTNAIEACPS